MKLQCRSHGSLVVGQNTNFFCLFYRRDPFSLSLQWGDALRILEPSGVIAQAALTKIHRQGIPELRAAIEDLSKGRTREGFDKLDKFGAIQEIADDDARLAAIAEKQIEALKAQRSSLIIAPTHGECRAIAGAVRKAMKERVYC